LLEFFVFLLYIWLIFVIKKLICLFFNITKLKKKRKKNPAYNFLCRTWEDLFSPTRSFNFITSIQMQRKFSPMAYYVKTLVCPWNVITFLWALLCIRKTIEVGHYMVLVHESNTKKTWKQTRFHKQNKARVWVLIVFFKNLSVPFVGPCLDRGQGPLPGIGLFSSICSWSCFALFDDRLSNWLEQH
jgi:hypothetical protein